jgi:hypothetical protein
VERARASTTEARRSPEHRLTAAAPGHCSLSGGTNRQACLEGCRDAGHCRVFHARTNAYLSSCPKEAALRCCLPRRGTLTLRPTARPSFVSARTGTHVSEASTISSSTSSQRRLRTTCYGSTKTSVRRRSLSGSLREIAARGNGPSNAASSYLRSFSITVMSPLRSSTAPSMSETSLEPVFLRTASSRSFLVMRALRI